jgi:hypothetical protein
MKRSVYALSITTALALAISPAQAAFSGLPNKAATPGATDPGVTQANIGKTICVIGYTKTVRPPITYTSPIKRRQLASGYNVGGDIKMGDYEEDHLVPLEVGGSPKSEANLWPEPLAGQWGARTKDKLENAMHLLVCSHQITLAAAQQVFMTDWIAGYKKYVK